MQTKKQPHPPKIIITTRIDKKKPNLFIKKKNRKIHNFKSGIRDIYELQNTLWNCGKFNLYNW